MKLAVTGAAVLGFAIAIGADSHADKTTLSGLLFGDYYWFAAHHDDAVEEQNGFRFRRIYLTHSQRVRESVDLRVRMELQSSGDLAAGGKLEPFLKDAYLRWGGEVDWPGDKAKRGQEIYLGLAPSPTFTAVEDAWGFRHVEKTPVDLYGLGSTREFGVGVRGVFAGNLFDYNVMIGNGAGTEAETNPGKKYMASVGVDLGSVVEGLSLRGNADYNDLEDELWRTTEQAMLLYKGDSMRGAVHYIYHKRELFREATVSVLSAYAARQLGKDRWAVARVDRSLDPQPDAAGIGHLPLAPGSKFWLILLGYEWQPTAGVRVTPNVTYVTYDEDIDADLVPKITLMYRWASDIED